MKKFRSLRLILPLLLCACMSGSNEAMLSKAQDIHDRGEKWLLSNMREKGLFRYIYNPKPDDYPDQNNAIRQLMASRLLAEMTRENPDLLPMHRKNVEFHMKHWYKEDGDKAYVLYSGNSKLGAIAMLLRTLVWSPDYEKYQEQAAKLANGILSLMAEDGSFDPFYVKPEYAYDKDYLLTFYSGEALVALAEYHMKTGRQDILEKTLKSQDFYVDRYVTHMAQNYYPAYVPWHSISLNLLWKITEKPEYAQAIFALNDELLKILDTTDQVGRFYNPKFPQYGKPHASSDGVYTEGLAYAYEIARLTGEKTKEETYLSALSIAVENIAKLQYTKTSLKDFDFERPDRALGAIRYSVDRTGVRVDSVQHSMDAMRKIMILFGMREEILFTESKADL